MQKNETQLFGTMIISLDKQVSFAEIAKACGVNGIQVKTMGELTSKLDSAVKDQMRKGVTTFIEAVLDQELGEPFRRDAMKTPVPVAGISKDDMCPQQGTSNR